jgi:hypothetical protein
MVEISPFSLTTLIFYLLSCAGTTIILVQGVIFQWMRDGFENFGLGKLINCSMCTGFWVGVFLAIMFGLKDEWIFYAGTASSVFSLLCERIFVMIDELIIHLSNK